MPSPPTAARARLPRVLALRDVVAMNLVAVVALRWITRGARIGAASVSLWCLAWVAFFLPLAAAVSELASRYPEQGGIYAWTRRAFGPRHAVLCAWCLWINNLFFFPSLLLFAGTNALLAAAGPAGASLETRAYSVTFVLVVLWLSTLVNVRGLTASKWVQNLGSIGTWAPAAMLVAFGATALARYGSATSFAPSNLVPHGQPLELLALWSAVCFAFSGLEVSSMLGEEVKNPTRTLPLGILLAGLAATVIYIAGSVSVLVAIPAGALSERSGIADAIDLVSRRIGLAGFGSITAALLAVGAVAQTNSWIAASGRVPFAAASDGLVPAFFARIHARYRTPHVALLAQGVIASAILFGALFLQFGTARTTIQEGYDILVNLTILAYFVPYLYLFAAFLSLRKGGEAVESKAGAEEDGQREGNGRPGQKPAPRHFVVPGGSAGRWLAGLVGLLSTAVSIALLFVPPAGTEHVLNYEANIIGQSAGVLAVGWWLGRRVRGRA